MVELTDLKARWPGRHQTDILDAWMGLNAKQPKPEWANLAAICYNSSFPALLPCQMCSFRRCCLSLNVQKKSRLYAFARVKLKTDPCTPSLVSATLRAVTADLPVSGGTYLSPSMAVRRLFCR